MVARGDVGMRSKASVTIIGAGIVGCSAAYFLSQMGETDIVVRRCRTALRDRRLDLARAWARLPDQRLEDDDQSLAGDGADLRLARARRATVLVFRREYGGRAHAGAVAGPASPPWLRALVRVGGGAAVAGRGGREAPVDRQEQRFLAPIGCRRTVWRRRSASARRWRGRPKRAGWSSMAGRR